MAPKACVTDKWDGEDEEDEVKVNINIIYLLLFPYFYCLFIKIIN